MQCGLEEKGRSEWENVSESGDQIHKEIIRLFTCQPFCDIIPNVFAMFQAWSEA